MIYSTSETSPLFWEQRRGKTSTPLLKIELTGSKGDLLKSLNSLPEHIS